MGRIVTIFFVGQNGIVSYNIGINPGQFGARILNVQKIAENISTTPTFMGVDVSSGFETWVGPTGAIAQNGLNDFSDTLFAANIEML